MEFDIAVFVGSQSDDIWMEFVQMHEGACAVLDWYNINFLPNHVKKCHDEDCPAGNPRTGIQYVFENAEPKFVLDFLDEVKGYLPDEVEKVMMKKKAPVPRPTVMWMDGFENYGGDPFRLHGNH